MSIEETIRVKIEITTFQIKKGSRANVLEEDLRKLCTQIDELGISDTLEGRELLGGIAKAQIMYDNNNLSVLEVSKPRLRLVS